jgi:hypothetical protein
MMLGPGAWSAVPPWVGALFWIAAAVLACFAAAAAGLELARRRQGGHCPEGEGGVRGGGGSPRERGGAR